MHTIEAKAAAVRGRRSVAAMFFVNGFLIGSWAPQIPVFLTRHGISESVLGLLLLVFGAGAVTFMAACGYLIDRYDSRIVVRGFAVTGVFGLLAVASAPELWSAAVAMFLFGGLIGGMDVAMNANAVTVERRLSRAIMSSSHGFWSVGGFVGGGTGGLMIERFGHDVHAFLVTAIALVVTMPALPHLIAERCGAAVGRIRFSLPRSASLYLVGLMALMSMIPEGAVLDWAALYLRQELGAGLSSAGLAFAMFSATMALTRFAGDGIRNRFGAVATLRLSSLVAVVGLLGAGLSPAPWLAILAFAFAGLGIANMVPIIFSAAGNQSGVSSGAGLSMVTLMGYSGILVAPSAIGFIGERTGFAPVFIAVSLLLLLVFLMAALVHGADASRTTPAA